MVCPNVHILIELLREGCLSPQHILVYLAYTVKIAKIVTRYTRQSTLAHDQAYRRLQAQLGFCWGSDAAHLATIHLVPRPVLPAGKKLRQPKPAATKKSQRAGSDQPLCQNYNRGACAYPACKFRHQCSSPHVASNTLLSNMRPHQTCKGGE